MSEIRIERLSEANFADYEKLTSCEAGGGCYCAFWHGRWNSVAEWDEKKKTLPLENREVIRQKIRFGFHVGVLAYRGDELLAWISVGPLPEFYWTWKRVARLGEAAATVAGIPCITIHESVRNQKLQGPILEALKGYGKAAGWTAIEGYPFEESAFRKHGKAIAWPGKASGFLEAGFQKIEAHWLSHPDYERSVYRADLGSTS